MDVKRYKWYIAVVADGTYHFVTPDSLATAEKFIGDHGGGLYTHAGYLVLAANRKWWEWLTYEYDAKYRTMIPYKRPPHIDVPNIKCEFSQEALKWLKENENELRELGGKYYDFIPRH